MRLIIIIIGHLIDPCTVNYLPATGTDTQHPSLVQCLDQGHLRNMMLATKVKKKVVTVDGGRSLESHLHPGAHEVFVKTDKSND